jgi:hypothetical protein
MLFNFEEFHQKTMKPFCNKNLDFKRMNDANKKESERKRLVCTKRAQKEENKLLPAQERVFIKIQLF